MAGQYWFGEEGYVLPVHCAAPADASRLGKEARLISGVSIQTVDLHEFNVIGPKAEGTKIRRRVKEAADSLGLEPHPSVLEDETPE